MIIAFEGTDCSFKETNSKELVKYLKSIGKKVIHLSFPNYKSKSTYVLRNYFKNLKDIQELTPKQISMIYLFDFYTTWYNRIDELSNKDTIIILDRWIYSNLYYQGIRVLEKEMNLYNDDSLAILNKIHHLEDFIKWYYDEVRSMNLPEADLVIKMTHNTIQTKKLILDRASKDNINEDNFLYLNKVQKLFNVSDDSMFLGNATVATVFLDKNDKEFYDKDHIFNLIKDHVDSFLNAKGLYYENSK